MTKKAQIIIRLITYTAYVILLLAHAFRNVLQDDIHAIVYRTGLAITGLSFVLLLFTLKTKHKTRDVLIAILFLISSLVSGNYTALAVILTILNISKIISHKFIKYDLYLRVIITVVIVALSTSGVIESAIVERQAGSIVRSSLGFSHPNTLSFYLYTILIEAIIVFNKQRIIPTITAIALAIACIYITDTRSILYISIISPVILLIVRLTEKSTLGRIAIRCIPWLICCTCITLLALYSAFPTTLAPINKILSGRLSLAQSYAQTYKPNIFGNKIINSVNNNKPLDISYINVLYQYGPICLIAILILYTILLSRAEKATNSSLRITIIISFLILSVLENVLLSVMLTPIILTRRNEPCLPEPRKA